jgi:ATP-dependent 26S proteasome regulatory subunit
MIEKKVKNINKQVNILKKELNLLKKNFSKKFTLLINEFQKISPSDYEIILEAQGIRDNSYGLIERVIPKKTFNNVILNEEIKSQINMVLSQIKNHDKLMHEWGLINLQENNSVSLLFSGPSGTGKTLTAEALSHELRKKLFIVKYSNLVDSYIGETGKNIIKVFELAKKYNAVLFFDEADAIASSRTQIYSATDSETNLTRNILLKELEKFDGIVVFATNLASNFDKAFERRIHSHIIFKVPELQEREKIWKLLSKTIPLDKDVNFYEIAKEFEFSGGHIKNSIINAARLSVSNNFEKVNHEHFMKSCRLVKEGKNTLLNIEENKDNINYFG